MQNCIIAEGLADYLLKEIRKAGKKLEKPDTKGLDYWKGYEKAMSDAHRHVFCVPQNELKKATEKVAGKKSTGRAKK